MLRDDERVVLSVLAVAERGLRPKEIAAESGGRIRFADAVRSLDRLFRRGLVIMRNDRWYLTEAGRKAVGA